MIYSNIVKRNYKGTEYEKTLDDLGVTGYRIQLKCDECEKVYETSVSNWRIRKNKKPNSLDFCSCCYRLGERNVSYGKDRSEILRHARSFQKINGMTGRHHTLEAKEKMSKRKADLISSGKFDIMSNNRGRKSKYFSFKMNEEFHADSILELARMKELDADSDVAVWTKKHGIRVKYTWNGYQRTYVPDFLIVESNIKIIEEVKGRFFNADLEKEEAAKKYCNENGFLYRRINRKDVKTYQKVLKEYNANLFRHRI